MILKKRLKSSDFFQLKRNFNHFNKERPKGTSSADKEIFERILAKVEIDKHLGYYETEIYINQDACYELFEKVMKEIYSTDIGSKFQDHLFDLLNKLEPASIGFKLTENEAEVKDVYLGHEEWDYEITLLKPIDYIFENCERIAG